MYAEVMKVTKIRNALGRGSREKKFREELISSSLSKDLTAVILENIRKIFVPAEKFSKISRL